ncbi:hypothetical protein CRUP_025196, partial [Coryphaenoides rupestris]
MQFVRRQRRLIANANTELYGHCLQFYGQPPLENISLTEFESFAVSPEEKKALSEKLINSSYSGSGCKVEEQVFYK